MFIAGYVFMIHCEGSSMIMKGVVLYKTNGPLVVEELEIPSLQDGQVLVKILFSGVCRAQINEIKAHKGPDKYLPHTLGHEASGIVEETGPGVKKVKKGDYVVLTWIKGEGIDAPSCTYTTHKDKKKINSGAITTFNQYSVISENRIVKIPKEVPPDIAALFGCAVPTGVGIVKNELKAKKGESLAIFGIGGIGSCVLLGAVSAGVSPIIAVDINSDKLEFAKENGATHTVNPKEMDIKDVVAKIKEITNNEGVDYSVDCAGIPLMIEAAFDAIKDTGTTIIAGNPAYGEKIRITPFDLIKGKKIFGSWGGSVKPDKDIPLFIQDYLSGKLKVDKLITKTYSLDKINDAIKSLGKGKVIRALIKMDYARSTIDK